MAEEIETVKDYILNSCPMGNFLFKSKKVIREGGADTYKIIGKHSLIDRYLHIEPVNGRFSEFETVHVLLRQHLDDSVIKISRQSA